MTRSSASAAKRPRLSAATQPPVPPAPADAAPPGTSPADALASLGGQIEIGVRRSIGNVVHERLRDAILNVQLLPNAVLSENELAGTLQVSRTPIREAIQKLASEGLVLVVPQVGTFVARMDLARIREAMFMREAVECAAMARLPRKLPQQAIERLERIVGAHLAAARNSDLANTLGSDEAFHRYLLELAGVPGVWRYVLEAREIHRRVRVLAQSQFDSAPRSAAQHAAIVAELAAGRPAKGANLLREHIRMNLLFAEDMARTYPSYFTEQSGPASAEASR